MNKKIRLYDVTVKNGYGERHEIVPGISKDYLIPKFETYYESVPQIDFIGWADVNMKYLYREEYFFEVTYKNDSFSFSDPRANMDLNFYKINFNKKSKTLSCQTIFNMNFRNFFMPSCMRRKCYMVSK